MDGVGCWSRSVSTLESIHKYFKESMIYLFVDFIHEFSALLKRKIEKWFRPDTSC